MRQTLIVLVSLLALGRVAPAYAETFTLFGSQITPKPDGFEPATVAGLRVSGRPFNLYGLKGRIALEAATDVEEGKTPAGRSFGFTTYGAYITARTPGNFYLLGEYGIARNRVDVASSGSTTDNQIRTSLGLGFTWGRMRIEATAGRFDDSNRLADSRWITLGFRF